MSHALYTPVEFLPAQPTEQPADITSMLEAILTRVVRRDGERASHRYQTVGMLGQQALFGYIEYQFQDSRLRGVEVEFACPSAPDESHDFRIELRARNGSIDSITLNNLREPTIIHQYWQRGEWHYMRVMNEDERRTALQEGMRALLLTQSVEYYPKSA